jgi:hypothetical protein
MILHKSISVRCLFNIAGLTLNAPVVKRPGTLQGVTITDADAPLLAMLPAIYRDVLQTSGNYKEIGEALGISSVGTVRSRLSRARSALVALRNSVPNAGQ